MFIGELVVLVNVSEILPLPLAATLLMPDTAARLQANIVPPTVLAGV